MDTVSSLTALTQYIGKNVQLSVVIRLYIGENVCT